VTVANCETRNWEEVGNLNQNIETHKPTLFSLDLDRRYLLVEVSGIKGCEKKIIHKRLEEKRKEWKKDKCKKTSMVVDDNMKQVKRQIFQQ
jgi:hypothetical protein